MVNFVKKLLWGCHTPKEDYKAKTVCGAFFFQFQWNYVIFYGHPSLASQTLACYA